MGGLFPDSLQRLPFHTESVCKTLILKRELKAQSLSSRCTACACRLLSPPSETDIIKLILKTLLEAAVDLRTLLTGCALCRHSNPLNVSVFYKKNTEFLFIFTFFCTFSQFVENSSHKDIENCRYCTSSPSKKNM